VAQRTGTAKRCAVCVVLVPVLVPVPVLLCGRHRVLA